MQQNTFYATNVIGDVLLEAVGIRLLLVEVKQMLLKDFICGFVSLSKVLKELKSQLKIWVTISFNCY